MKNLDEQPMLDGVYNALTELTSNNFGYELVVVTAIEDFLVNKRIACFKRHGLPIREVVATGWYGSRSKRPALEKLNQYYL